MVVPSSSRIISKKLLPTHTRLLTKLIIILAQTTQYLPSLSSATTTSSIIISFDL